MTTGSARVIVLVILIVVAIIATYAVVNFIMSLIQASVREYEVVPQAYISQSQATSEQRLNLSLHLYIVNRGSGSDRIILIELDCGKALYISRRTIEVKPNEAFNVTIDDWIKVREEGAIVPGDVCRLRLHSEKYGVVLLRDVVIAGS